MSLWKTYHKPKSVDEAIDLLTQAENPTAVIAGGTDLLLDLKQGRHSPIHTLVDISHIEEMQQISHEEGMIYLGAGLPLAKIIANPLILNNATCLVEACGLIGGPQVRNVATLGGNVAHALPAGDGAIALLALNAEAEIATRDGRKWLDLLELYQGPGITTFDRSMEILVRFRFRERSEREQSAFRRVMRPQGVAIAIQNMAVWLSNTVDGVIREARIALGPAGPVPFRAVKTEQMLQGSKVIKLPFEQALSSLRAEAQLRTSRHRATKEYRTHLLGTLLKRTLTAALEA
jgi:carbon-monoxide dehydrogenase medium subunit